MTLHGYCYSVYTRTVRMVLQLKDLPFDYAEVNPFGRLPPRYRELHPFGLVPVLVNDGWTLYETAAITRYIDHLVPHPSLQPEDPRARARMDQAIAVIDNHAYWPMMRQAFASAIRLPDEDESGDSAAIVAGLAASAKALEALEQLASTGEVFDGPVTLADCHFAPMADYFCMIPEGREMFGAHMHLARWWGRMTDHPAVVTTRPDLPAPPRP